MQSLHVPTLILGHSMAKAGKERRQSWCGGQLGLFRHPTPGTHAGLSTASQTHAGGPGRVLNCLADLQLGWLELTPDPRKCKDMAFAHLSVLCSLCCWAAFGIPHYFTAHETCWEDGRLGSPVVIISSTQVTAGSWRQQSRGIFCKTKSILVTTWDVPQG